MVKNKASYDSFLQKVQKPKGRIRLLSRTYTGNRTQVPRSASKAEESLTSFERNICILSFSCARAAFSAFSRSISASAAESFRAISVFVSTAPLLSAAFDSSLFLRGRPLFPTVGMISPVSGSTRPRYFRTGREDFVEGSYREVASYAYVLQFKCALTATA